MRTIIRSIDSISEWTGRSVSWVCVVLVLVLCYEVLMRYVFSSPTSFVHELSGMLGGTIAALGWSYTHRYRGHVRVDVIYTHLSPRGKATIDVLLTLLLFFPLIAILIKNSAESALFAFKMGEVSRLSFWYPPAWPIKTVMFLGLSLFAFQGIAHFIRDFYQLVKDKPYD
jgi:TRAP-type mannitol/chloroaromatic compound transport system permease small subunit